MADLPQDTQIVIRDLVRALRKRQEAISELLQGEYEEDEDEETVIRRAHQIVEHLETDGSTPAP